MTHRRDIDLHRRKLSEIRDIMESMKTLAYLETHKLNRLISSQHKLANNIDELARDFLHFYPETLPEAEPQSHIMIVIGSQRGFCGNFNEMLFEHVDLSVKSEPESEYSFIIVGLKMQPHMDEISHGAVLLDGANVAEEIRFVVEKILQVLVEKRDQLITLQVLYHGTEEKGMLIEKLLPPFSQTRKIACELTIPPLLNLKPDSFLIELTDHYLFSALHRVLFDSLMTENEFRAKHLENAVNHLDKKTSELLRKSNALRQEEIIEEIEVILLNSSIA